MAKCDGRNGLFHLFNAVGCKMEGNEIVTLQRCSRAACAHERVVRELIPPWDKRSSRYAEWKASRKVSA